MDCPYCKKSVTVFSVEKDGSGKGTVCPHCKKGVKVSFSIPALLLWLVPAVILVVLLYPWLGMVATVLGGSAALFLSLRIKPVA